MNNLSWISKSYLQHSARLLRCQKQSSAGRPKIIRPTRSTDPRFKKCVLACLKWECIIACDSWFLFRRLTDQLSNIVEVALDCLRFINPCIACMSDKYLIDLFVRANNANILKVFDFWTKVSESKSRSRYYRTSHSHEFTCLKMILWFYFPSSLRRIYEIDEICHKMTLLPFIWNHFRFSKSVKSSTAVKFNHWILKLSPRCPNELISLSYY